MTWLKCNATGKGVKVAVIDSGIDVKHPQLQGTVCQAVELVREGSKINFRDIDPKDCYDDFGHGTSVAGIISDIAPGVEIVSVKILDKQNTCTGDVLISALEWVVEQDIGLVNMSLSLNSEKYIPQLFKICERAYAKNISIVAAKNNFKERLGCPAMFASVISVDKEQFNEPFLLQFNQKKIIEFTGRGINVKVPVLNGSYSKETGNSFATPHVTGFCAILKSIYGDLSSFELKVFLKHLSSEL